MDKLIGLHLPSILECQHINGIGRLGGGEKAYGGRRRCVSQMFVAGCVKIFHASLGVVSHVACRILLTRALRMLGNSPSITFEKGKVLNFCKKIIFSFEKIAASTRFYYKKVFYAFFIRNMPIFFKFGAKITGFGQN